MLVHLILSQRSLRLSSVLFILFTLFCSSEVISTILSSSSLICSSASDILLLLPSRVFLISVLVLFVSVCLFFNTSRSCSLILACSPFCFQGFHHLYYHFSESFSGSLPISSLFIWTSVFLICSFICVVLLCLFIIYIYICFFFLTYCVWGLLFPGFKVEFFLPFGFSPTMTGPVVCVHFIKGTIFAVSLAFPLMGKAEWGGNPVCWWLGLYFCFLCCLDEASCTGCYWRLGDAGSCIQVVSLLWVLTIWYPLGLDPW